MSNPTTNEARRDYYLATCELDAVILRFDAMVDRDVRCAAAWLALARRVDAVWKTLVKLRPNYNHAACVEMWHDCIARAS